MGADYSARKRTRTSTGLPQLGPEPSASTNSAIRAKCPQQDSNLYAISGTGTSSQPVCQFQHVGFSDIYGAEGSRTPYLLNAIQALSQLSYSPNTTRIFKNLYETGLTGIEPATSAVTVRHSNQAELQPQTKRETGFEPATFTLAT
jgi:hypothetical protein